jgi:hypothetical protein
LKDKKKRKHRKMRNVMKMGKKLGEMKKLRKKVVKI